MLLLVFALKPDKRNRFHSLSSALLGISLSFGMFTAGLEKLVRWVDFDLSTNGVLRWFYGGYFTLDRQDLLADAVLHFPPLLLEIMDYSAVIFELTPFVCLYLGRAFWKGWILVACTFHLANVCLLNIAFNHHIPIYLAFFLFPLLDEKRLRSDRYFRIFLKVSAIIVIIIGTMYTAKTMADETRLFLEASRVGRLWRSVFMWLGCTTVGVISLVGELKVNQSPTEAGE